MQLWLGITTKLNTNHQGRFYSLSPCVLPTHALAFHRRSGSQGSGSQIARPKEEVQVRGCKEFINQVSPNEVWIHDSVMTITTFSCFFKHFRAVAGGCRSGETLVSQRDRRGNSWKSGKLQPIRSKTPMKLDVERQNRQLFAQPWRSRGETRQQAAILMIFSITTSEEIVGRLKCLKGP